MHVSLSLFLSLCFSLSFFLSLCVSLSFSLFVSLSLSLSLSASLSLSLSLSLFLCRVYHSNSHASISISYPPSHLSPSLSNTHTHTLSLPVFQGDPHTTVPHQYVTVSNQPKKPTSGQLSPGLVRPSLRTSGESLTSLFHESSQPIVKHGC